MIADLTHILRRDERPASIFGYGTLLRQPIDAEVLDRVGTFLTDDFSRRASRPS